jgi:hypothetical protein
LRLAPLPCPLLIESLLVTGRENAAESGWLRERAF